MPPGRLQEMLLALQPSAGFIDTLAEAQDLTLDKPRTAAERRLFEQLRERKGASGASHRTAHIRTQDCSQEELAECNNHAHDAEDDEATAAHAPPIQPESSVVLQDAKEAKCRSSSSSAQDTMEVNRSTYCCQYTQFPASVRDSSAATPAELTAANMDKSHLLSKWFLSRPFGALRLLAELQFSYVTFVVGKSLRSVCSCHSGQSPDPLMYTASGLL